MSRDLKADRAICDAATPGPWFDCSTADEVGPIRSISEEDHAYTEICHDPEGDDREADRTFIVAAREGWPAALDQLEAIRAALHDFRADKNLEWYVFTCLVAADAAAANHLLTFMERVRAAVGETA